MKNVNCQINKKKREGRKEKERSSWLDLGEFDEDETQIFSSVVENILQKKLKKTLSCYSFKQCIKISVRYSVCLCVSN